MPDAQCTRSLACKCETKHTSVVTTGSPESPGIPARNGFNGFLRALPGVRILGCHRHQRIKVLSDPVGPTCLRKFSTSNGCQDHTTSPSANSACRPHALRPLTRFISPCDPRTCPTLPRPPHPIPRP
jgi:hypothetical protein